MVTRIALGALLILALLPATALASSRAPVLYVGDSLGVGTIPYYSPDSLDSDVRVGRTSSEGLAILRSKLRPRHRTVIFDLGTNDWNPETLAHNLRAARASLGRRLLVVLTINKPGAEPYNRVLRAFAANAARVVLVDWRSASVASGLLAGDHIHATSEGYRKRAWLIAYALR